MILSEEEARTRWCPQTGGIAAMLTVVRQNTPFNGLSPTTQLEKDGRLSGGKCLASQCMAWRWTAKKTGIDDKTAGFCGLALNTEWRPYANG